MVAMTEVAGRNPVFIALGSCDFPHRLRCKSGIPQSGLVQAKRIPSRAAYCYRRAATTISPVSPSCADVDGNKSTSFLVRVGRALSPAACRYRRVATTISLSCPAVYGKKSTSLLSTVEKSTLFLVRPGRAPLAAFWYGSGETTLFLSCGAVYGEKSTSLLPTDEVQKIVDSIKWDKNGLVVAIVQHLDTGEILMQAYVNSEAVEATIVTRKATFYSRSRSSLWIKGETSSNFIYVEDVFIDCDRDSLIYLGLPYGPTCHTGSKTCFFTSVRDLAKSNQTMTTLFSLEHTIQKRHEALHGESAKPSWTQKLLGNKGLLCSKIREEADELCRTIEDDEGKSRTTSEMADVLYHCMVLLAVKGVKVEEVLEVLRARFTQSGIEEKNSRN